MTPSFQLVTLDVGAEALEGARATLAVDEVRRAERFLRDEDRRRFVAARALLRRTLGSALGIAPERVAFVYGAHGKPALAPSQAESGIRFNLSHSAGRAFVAWTSGREIGTDLEAIRPVRFGEKIARRFFSGDEREIVLRAPDATWDATFFRCWTRKEAFIKAVGDGLSYPLRSFSVPMGEAPSQAPIRVHDDAEASRRWSLSTIDAGPGFLAAFVVERG